MTMWLKFDVLFFEQYNQSTLVEVCRGFKAARFAKDDCLFKAGEQFDSLYLIVKGSIGVFQGTDLREPIEIRSVTQMIGERALMNGEYQHSKTVIAMEDCLCLEL